MANMMYDTMTKLPPRRSALEALMLAIRLRRDVQDIYRTYAMIQAVRDKSESAELIQDAFNKFKDSMMPYASDSTVKADERVVDRLKEEIARGPLQVSKVKETSRIRSRLKAIARKTARLGPLGK